MFGHPYTPYSVQEQFMQDLYSDLSLNGVVLFESPTGTGKTLSLLCPTVSWVRNALERRLELDLAEIKADGGPEWLQKQAEMQRRAQFDEERRVQKNIVNEVLEFGSKAKRPRLESSISVSVDLDPLKPANQIIFASRTHSQLSQVAKALRSLKLEPVRYVQLGSRQQLCINPEVKRLKSVTLMNDRCSELQRANKCEFRHNNIDQLKKQALTQIMDIEELASAGKELHSCAYYAARDASPYAEVVGVPYPLLLVSRTRDALSMDLSNSIVVIDEAHNLLEALSSLHSKTLSENTLKLAIKGLNLYIKKVVDHRQFLPINRRKIMQIATLLNSLLNFFEKLPQNSKPGTEVEAVKLLAAKNADTLDVPELAKFVTEFKLMFKIDSYLAAEAKEKGDERNIGGSLSLSTVMDFVTTCLDPCGQGKLFIDSESGKTILRYLVLDTSNSFREIVEQSSAVVLAGGTMEPTSEFKHHLFPYLDTVGVHSYGHIIPPSQLLVFPVTGMKFTFAERGKPEVIAKLGSKLLEIASSVPNGVVVFFPGYAYLEQVVAHMRHHLPDVYKKLYHYKSVFIESRTSNSDLFAKYADAASHGKGALLLAVVGGKLSEGINFSDELARAVVMIGLPYPNAFSAEMVAKRGHIEAAAHQRGLSQTEAKEEAKQYYENLAMRAVNQSVGRAIRHIKDYAVLYLIDDRFELPQIQQKLSKWVQNGIKESTDLTGQTIEFFKTNCI